MLVEWRPRARRQLKEIYEYIEERDPPAAESLVESIRESVMTLAENPFIYRRGRVPNTREMVVHPNYLVIYRVSDRVTVLNVLHARIRYPSENEI
ncbi:type II toxin-antitoxin system RelE/ParE family toxin [Caballeronia sp. LZ035]|uniref:type II toxin-antitoxin system RelE/ParE family toxin n=1 Tax=Caballeronia sp. LZ035 TaxID=3038568 RepID=UPI00286368C2|nr:type II toxin-antitoxin system RelE/ParE family toxin [Caballeronia sp. LZ035]MDR5755792.1 type II toxin-antitoxin system RelE/ParE family toxin [Caballeronia sp. LZ035]